MGAGEEARHPEGQKGDGADLGGSRQLCLKYIIPKPVTAPRRLSRKTWMEGPLTSRPRSLLDKSERITCKDAKP